MNEIISFVAGGLLQASWWQVALITLGLTHITIAAVTIFLHRSQAHRGLDLHPLVMHFFRFWLWLTTGMVTKEWVAIHRKHHARCEREGDPHSPMIYGINKVMFSGAELYRHESKNAETLAKFGHGTPDDWMERHFYGHNNWLGVGLIRKPRDRFEIETEETLSGDDTTWMRRGFLTNLLNPKIALMYAALIPQFVDPTAGPVWQQALVLGGVQILVAVTVNALIVCCAAAVSTFLMARPVWMRAQKWLAGGILGIFATRMALE